jgi:hypothetical protein
MDKLPRARDAALAITRRVVAALCEGWGWWSDRRSGLYRSVSVTDRRVCNACYLFCPSLSSSWARTSGSGWMGCH